MAASLDWHDIMSAASRRTPAVQQYHDKATKARIHKCPYVSAADGGPWRQGVSPLEQSPLVLDVQDGVPAVRDVERPRLQLRRHHVRDLEANLHHTHKRLAQQPPAAEKQPAQASTQSLTIVLGQQDQCDTLQLQTYDSNDWIQSSCDQVLL